jgi:hypothetical protein
MRDVDLESLRQVYADPSVPPERRLAASLGVDTPAVDALCGEIANDLDETTYGIGWWAPEPDTSRRILISDHLIQCTEGISNPDYA